MNTITFTKTVKDSLEFSTLNYPTLIKHINTKLSEVKIKVNPLDKRPIQIRSVHQHPSNNLVLYTTTSPQAKALRAQSMD